MILKGQTIQFKDGVVEAAHGSGGLAMSTLIEKLFMTYFDNPWLSARNDSAVFEVSSGRMVMSTDAHVVSPLFFPGGDIGVLSVYGTVNDLAMSGAKPLYLSASFILEQGFPLSDLEQIVRSMAWAAKQAGVHIITGDTKVVERGQADGVYISTAGVGIVPFGLHITGANAKVGDKILVSGAVGDHGIAIMSYRQHLNFGTSIQSDTRPLNDLVMQMVNTVPEIHCLRDPTRGGLATTLNELAKQSSVGMVIDEASIPIKTEVASACEFLGLDPLYVANEGILIAICPADKSEALLEVMQAHEYGQDAALIGEVIQDDRPLVQLKTTFGGARILDWLNGEYLPRIC